MSLFIGGYADGQDRFWDHKVNGPVARVVQLPPFRTTYGTRVSDNVGYTQHIYTREVFTVPSKGAPGGSVEIDVYVAEGMSMEAAMLRLLRFYHPC